VVTISAELEDTNCSDILPLVSSFISRCDGYSKVKEDLRKLKDAGLLSLTNGNFVRYLGEIDYEGHRYDYIYVYHYDQRGGGHAMFSSVKYSSIRSIASTSTVDTFQPEKCLRHDNHYSLMPFFHGDYSMILQGVLEETSFPVDLKEWLTKSMKEYGKRYSTQMNENDWTERLHHGLQSMKINSEFTATYQSNHKKYWGKRVPKDISERVFLFRGSPDLIVYNSGIVHSICGDDSVPTEGEELREDDSQSSQESGRIELSKKSDTSYETFIIEKGGELVAAIHQGLVCKALRRISKGQSICNLVGNGLLIDRGTVVIHYKVTFGMCKLQVQAHILRDCMLDAEGLCNCFTYFLDVLKKV